MDSVDIGGPKKGRLMNNRTARVLVTYDCTRNCSYCCNKSLVVKDAIKEIDSFEQLTKYQDVCITGGEPLLVPDKVKQLIADLRLFSEPGQNIYLYTQTWTPEFKDILPKIDGFTYSVHEDANTTDATHLVLVEQDVELMLLGIFHNSRYKPKMRLHLTPGINAKLIIRPKLWDRIKVLDIVEDGNCLLPTEDYFYLQ